MNTGTKGDIGEYKAVADLLSKGFEVLSPVSSVSPYDLVVIKDNCFWRVQVKYRSIKSGSIKIQLRRKSIERTSIQYRPLIEVEVLCIYCPETDKCYYFSVEDKKYFCVTEKELEENKEFPNVRGRAVG